MARSSPNDELSIYLAATQGMCRQCRQIVEARYQSNGREVYLLRFCPTHGIQRTLVAESLSWYLAALQTAAAPRPPRAGLVPRLGSCPTSCGPCEFHAQRCNLPVFSITNACNLECPICFTYNRQDRRFFMSAAEFERQIEFVIGATGGVDVINITGGEPTLHPELFALLAHARRPEIGRITLNSNGLTLAADPQLAQRLADEGIYLILSCDSFDPSQNQQIHGRDLSALKRQALENLERFGVQTTLLMVLIGGVNEDQLATLVELTLQHDFIRSLTIQTMAYTGQGGGDFLPRRPLTVDGVERRLEAASGGRIAQRDFLPLPTAHPLCYGVTYLLVDNRGELHPFTELLGREVIASHLTDGYLLHPTATLERDLRAAIDRLWSEGGHPELLRAIKELLVDLYPSGGGLSVHHRQRRAERRIKTIYVHAHMDEDNYEVGRAMRCPDQVPIDATRFVGACNYNLFYRMHDQRFWVPS